MSNAYRAPAGSPIHRTAPYEMPQQYVRPFSAISTAPPKSAALAVILSIVLPGLGSLYAGSTAAAVLWFVAALAAWLSVLILIGFLLVPFVMFAACVHAWVSAELYNERHRLVG